MLRTRCARAVSSGAERATERAQNGARERLRYARRAVDLWACNSRQPRQRVRFFSPLSSPRATLSPVPYARTVVIHNIVVHTRKRANLNGRDFRTE